jgi:hypothetical protein
MDIKKYKRFFAFGDSFTSYYWPMWADILGNEFEFFENWGLKGAGNHYIFNSIIECNQRHKFNNNDLIIVMWTGITREDRYVNNHWSTAATQYRETMYGTEWMHKFGTEIRGNLIRDLAYIKASQSLLENTKCDYHFLNSVDIIKEDNDVVEVYSDVLSTIKPSFHDIIKNSVRPNSNDLHPTPLESVQYMKDYLGIDLKNDYVDYWENIVWNISEKNVTPFTKKEITRF